MLAFMPAFLWTSGFTVLVFTDDHEPAHVHVIRARSRMRFTLGEDHITLDKITGRPKKSDVRRAAKIVAENLEACWSAWRKYHG